MRRMLTLMITAQVQKQIIQTLPVNQSHDNTIVIVSVLQVWLPYAGKLGHLVLSAGNEEKEYGWIGSIIDLALTLTAAS